MSQARAAVAAFAIVALACRGQDAPPPAPSSSGGQTIRVAVIGGMVETGFWQALAERYQAARGHRIELAAAGPKAVVVDAFRHGGIDLITVHACDAMINLVADGLARDPQPWARNDLVIVGPAADPAQIRGERDAVRAVSRIVAARAPLLVHASLGADGSSTTSRRPATSRSIPVPPCCSPTTTSTASSRAPPSSRPIP